MRDFEVLVLGAGSKLKEYKSQYSNLPITFLGNVKNPLKYLNIADVFIFPSRREGLGNSLIEAQILGLSIISSDCPSGPKEILMNGKLGDLFAVGDYKKLCEKIYRFSNNKKLLKEKAILAKKYLYRYDYEKNLKKYTKIIKKYYK